MTDTRDPRQELKERLAATLREVSELEAKQRAVRTQLTQLAALIEQLPGTVHDRDADTMYQVVVNGEEQYSIWPEGKSLPRGWKAEGTVGAKAECLAHIERVWTDMRPLSTRTSAGPDGPEHLVIANRLDQWSVIPVGALVPTGWREVARGSPATCRETVRARPDNRPRSKAAGREPGNNTSRDANG